ncbi:MAG: IS630 family transposase [Planctomycetota bacterium]
MRIAPKIDLTKEQRQELQRLVSGRRTEVRVATRTRIVRATSRDVENKEIAIDLGVSRETVGRWRSRFAEEGVDGLLRDLPCGGRKPTARLKVEGRIIRVTTQKKPENATHWSTRTLAEELGVTQSMIHRVWTANGRKPHLVRTSKISNDPHFQEKLRDVVGLYLNPPENALFSAPTRRRPSKRLIERSAGCRSSRAGAGP